MKYERKDLQLIKSYRQRFLIDPINTLPSLYVGNHNTRRFYIYNTTPETNHYVANTVEMNDKYIDTQVLIYNKKYGEHLIELHIHSIEENKPSLSISRTTAIRNQSDLIDIIDYVRNIMNDRYHIKIEETIERSEKIIYE